VGDDSGHIYGLERQSGTLAWEYVTGDAIAAGLGVADDTLYVGSLDRRLHAFRLEAE